jgi:hypothetical protein
MQSINKGWSKSQLTGEESMHCNTVLPKARYGKAIRVTGSGGTLGFETSRFPH